MKNADCEQTAHKIKNGGVDFLSVPFDKKKVKLFKNKIVYMGKRETQHVKNQRNNDNHTQAEDKNIFLGREKIKD